MPDVAAEVAAIPEDLRIALAWWWRAHHHGSMADQIDAEEQLCAAINPRIEALRATIHKPS